MKNSEYWKAVQSLHKSRSHFAKLLRSTTLSPSEKTLLEARRALVDHDWETTIQMLLRFSPAESLLRAERGLLIAEAYNRLGRNFEALEAVRSTSSIYRELGDFPGVFQGLIAMAINLHVQGHLEDAISLLAELEPLAQTEIQKHQVFRETQYCHLKLGKIDDVSKIISRFTLESRKFPARHRQISDHAIAYFLMNRGLLKEAQKYFEFCMKAYPKLSRLNAKFWVALLSTAIDGRTLRAPEAVIRKSPVYLHRYLFIREIQAGNHDRAALHWNELRELFPRLYGEVFEFKQNWVERSAFGILALRFKASKASGKPATAMELLEEQLLEILRTAGGPVSKEQLIERLYAQAYEVSLEPRFYKLVQRTKKRFPDVKILTRAGGYRIE